MGLSTAEIYYSRIPNLNAVLMFFGICDLYRFQVNSANKSQSTRSKNALFFYKNSILEEDWTQTIYLRYKHVMCTVHAVKKMHHRFCIKFKKNTISECCNCNKYNCTIALRTFWKAQIAYQFLSNNSSLIKLKRHRNIYN